MRGEWRCLFVAALAGCLLALVAGCARSVVPRDEPPLAEPVREEEELALKEHMGEVEKDRDGTSPSSIQGDVPSHTAVSLKLTARAETRLAAGEVASAVDDLERALQIDPSNPFAYLGLARARFAGEEYGQAASFATRAGLLFRDRPYWASESHLLTGQCNEAMGRYGKAEALYQKALEANPGNEEARLLLEELGGAADVR